MKMNKEFFPNSWKMNAGDWRITKKWLKNKIEVYIGLYMNVEKAIFINTFKHLYNKYQSYQSWEETEGRELEFCL